MATRVGDGCDHDTVFAEKERDIVREAGQVDAPVAARTLAPQERMLDDGRTSALHLLAEPNSQTRNSRFVISGGTLDLRARLWEELENEAHRPGAIRRKRANTSFAGIGSDAPASRRSIRRAISASQAVSAPGSGSNSTLSSRRRASLRP